MGQKYSAGSISGRHARRMQVFTKLGLGVVLLAGIAGSSVALADRVGSSVYLHPPMNAVVDPTPHLLSSPFPAQVNESAFSAQSPAAATTGADWLNIQVRSGDTISTLFDHYDLPMSDWMSIVALGDDVASPLTSIRSGDVLHIRRGSKGGVAELRYALDAVHTLHIVRNADSSFSVSTLTAKTTKRHGYAVGVIESSMYNAGHKAGMSNALIMQMAHIFRWDVDFAKDIRAGDRFSVVYEEILKNGKVISTGNILAAEFDANGHAYRAFRYLHDDDAHYYDAEGRPLRKAFLRAPVDFTRISSRFGRRYHPIQHRWKMHEGVDYAAPTGTPIKAAGDGRIVYRGWERGYGRVIKIKHPGHIETLYGHMSRFKNGLQVGSHVEQGQVIGYVGQSGWATGPHVHFEFHVNGHLRNPLTVKLPGAPPLPKQQRTAFLGKIKPYLSQLHALAEIRLASNTTLETASR